MPRVSTLFERRWCRGVNAAREKATFLFDLLHSYLQSRGEMVRRLTADFAHDPIWSAGLTAALTDVLGEIRLMQSGLDMIRIRMEGAKKPDESVMPLIGEMIAVGRRLEGAAFALEGALRPPPKGEPLVRWIELRGREGNVGVSAVPLDLAPILREDLFSRSRDGDPYERDARDGFRVSIFCRDGSGWTRSAATW